MYIIFHLRRIGAVGNIDVIIVFPLGFLVRDTTVHFGRRIYGPC